MRLLKFIYTKLKLSNLVKYLRQNYASFAKFYLSLMLQKNAKQQAILVYTMGKVGSTSISTNLQSQLKEYSVYDIHWLNRKNLVTDQQFHKKYYDRNRDTDIKLDVLPGFIIRGFYVNKLLNSNKEIANDLEVITLARDPVAKEVSSFFQNLKRFFGYDFDDLDKRDTDVLTDELIDVFLNDYISPNSDKFFDADPLTWFDNELKEVFDIDVYSERFPTEKGYSLYEKSGVRVLLIRLEDLNECFSKASAELLGKSFEILESKNVGDNKNYASIYKAFKYKLTLPNWYLDKMYESKYAKHFYDKSEIKLFRDKWTKNTITAK